MVAGRRQPPPAIISGRLPPRSRPDAFSADPRQPGRERARPQWSDGRIEVFACALGYRVEFVIRDSGPGIAPEHLPHVFDRLLPRRPLHRRCRPRPRHGQEPGWELHGV